MHAGNHQPSWPTIPQILSAKIDRNTEGREEGNLLLCNYIWGSADHCVMGVQLISQLIAEINEVSKPFAKKFLNKRSKTIQPFRDIRLFSIFQLSCTLLRTALGNVQTLSFADERVHALMTRVLQLAQRCLIFNSRETASDESGDEMVIVKIPTSWRPAFLDMSTVQLFFDLYAHLPATLSSMTLTCLVQLASVRRDIFSINEERVRFLSQLTNGVRNMLKNPQDLSHPSNYHQFCRLVLRLKRNYQIDELVSVEDYSDAIQLIAQFTKDFAHKWQSASKSICCLLSFWHNMVYCSHFMLSKRPHLLEIYTHEIVKVYISFYLESASVVQHEGLEDPLDDVSVIQPQLQMLLSIGRYEYSRTYELLVQVFGQTAQHYQQVITAHLNHEFQQHSMEDIAVLEGQLTWLVYMIISAIDRRSLSASSDDADAMDGDLVCRVLQLMNFTDPCLPGRGCKKWELALIALFQKLLRTYVSGQIHETSGFYGCLSQTLGINDESKILAVFMQKIIVNLKHWSHCEQLLHKTLRLMLDITVGHEQAMKLARLDAVQVMLNNHTSEQFPFLAIGEPVQVMRHRTSFYTCLGRLLILDLGEDEEKFIQFMIPITSALDNVKQLLAQADTPVFRAEEAKKELIGLARDLRGLAHGLDSPISCMMFFYWIYPTCTAIMIQSMEIWHHDPQVTTPVLKLFAEIIHRSSKLQFHASSSNGILLFQEASKILSTYGSGVLAQSDSIPKDQIYPMRLKGISICFSMLKLALYQDIWSGGRLRQFGGDMLATAFCTFANLLPCIPLSDLQVHRYLSLDYHSVLVIMTRDHLNFIVTLEPNVLLYILSSSSEGLSDTETCSSCCLILDHLFSYLYKCLHHETGEMDTMNLENDTLVKLVQEQPSILHQILTTTLEICMSEEFTFTELISQPLLPLILLNREYFGQLRKPIISRYTPERQAAVARWLDGLMEGIEPNLLSSNRCNCVLPAELERRHNYHSSCLHELQPLQEEIRSDLV
ncbi:exportin-7-like isoform X3 [Portunus trituberculatus]|uniref:exportin-7-like isoform X3 n=1 Tax=Portunus trituberculatus TaxID=210409 RepID=UPI001E1CC445|nr:exportin-7-like isoform X3 [Portunus trituberculatus]